MQNEIEEIIEEFKDVEQPLLASPDDIPEEEPALVTHGDADSSRGDIPF